MKRKVSILLLLVLLLTFVPNVNADDNFNVSHTSIKSNDDVKSINVILPIFEGFNGADEINEKIFNIALNAIGDANTSAKFMKGFKEEALKNGEPAYSAAVDLDIVYDYVKQGDILSVQLTIYSYYGGAHGTTQILSITSNTLTGQIYEFKDLFKQGTDYNSVITKYILDEIAKNTEEYFPDYYETIINKNGDYEFYIDGDKIVVYFGLYDIAPYAAGIRHFSIDAEDIKDILKDEVFDSIKDGKERGTIYFNGKDMNSNSEIKLTDDYAILLPLRTIAEILGYKVDWNINDGATVNGQAIKDVVTPIVLDGTTYVPLSYFKDTLNENVSLGMAGNDKTVVRVFSKDSLEDYLYNRISEFESPETPDEAIKMYAEAVKQRNGVVQYGLMSESLREEMYNQFKDMAFVTGTSSPWVDSYEISRLEENLFQIRFTLKTSSPSDLFISVINVELIEDGQYMSIGALKEDM